MIYHMHSCERLNSYLTIPLQFIGFGIRHSRRNVEQIIPNLHNDREHYSLVFNHEALQITIDGAPMQLPANTLVVWDRSRRVLYGEPGKQWRLSWLQLAGEKADALLEDHEIPLNTPVTFDSERIINNYWMPLLEESSEYIQLDLPLILHHISGILLEIRRARKHAEYNRLRIPESFLHIRNYMNDNYTKELTLTKLAARIHLAPIYFSRKFKEYFGLAPINYIIELRLHEAAILLRNSSLSIQQVAEQVGYKDSFHFSKLFKRHFGTAPQSFRVNT